MGSKEESRIISAEASVSGTKTVVIGACAPIHPASVRRSARMSPSGRICSYFCDQHHAHTDVLLPTQKVRTRRNLRPASQWRRRATDGAPLRTAPVICNFAPMTLFGRQQGTTMRIGLTTAALTLIPTAAFAHPGIGDAHGFVHGFAHPLGGLDHIL